MTSASVIARPSLYSAQTDPGRKRDHNEDYLAVFEADAAESGAPRMQVAIVADGVGGHQAGERASEMATVMVRMVMTRDTHLPPPERITRAVRAANEEVYGASLDRPDQEGMGTTLVMAVIAGDALYGAHVGDSRAYLYRDGAFERLTADHTWAQEAIEAGYLTPERARTHTNRNVIRRYVGTQDALEVDRRLTDVTIPANSDNPYAPRPTVESLPVQPGDIVLLCSDGLTDELRDDEIAAILGKTPFERAAERLVKEANQRGGRDNITVVLLQVGTGGGLAAAGPTHTAGARASMSNHTEVRRAAPHRRVWLPVAAALVLLPLLGLGAWAALRDREPPVAAVTAPSATAALVAAIASPSPTPEATQWPLPATAPSTTSAPATIAPLDATSTPIPVSSPAETQEPATTRPPQGGAIPPAANTRLPVTSLPASAPSVLLLEPGEEADLSGTVAFRFEADRAPTRGQAYEVVFWKPGQDPGADGFSPGLYTEARLDELRFNLDALYEQSGSKFAPGDYLWGIRLIQLEPFRVLRLLSEPRRFHFERSGQGRDNRDQPTAVPPTAVPPTAVPPTAVPPTAVPPTAVPPTPAPPPPH